MEIIKLETFSEMSSAVIEGEVNPLEIYIELKHIEKALKKAMGTVQGYAIDEAEKHGEKTFNAFGAEVGIKNSAGHWNFKKLDWWEEFQEKQDSAKQSYQMAKKRNQMVDEEGVLVEPAEYTEGKLTIAISLK